MTATLIAIIVAVTIVAPALQVQLSPVLTGSMRPAFSPGDLLITAPADVGDLHAGQIAVFTPPGENAPYAHRITSVTGDSAHPVLTTKGDANPANDRWKAVLSGPKVPVVFATVPYVGYALLWTQSPALRAILVGLLGLLMTSAGIRHILRQPSTAPSNPEQSANTVQPTTL
ncbi:signal peptidase I [Micrococcaceae bacterium Sec5.7]